jgi:threonine dehydrogenase-like Zn-dependent dehydrogenase
MLIYRGQLPRNMPLDTDIAALKNDNFRYPLKYGYSLVGEVAALGPDVAPKWKGRRVFCFHPHESGFISRIEDVVMLPDDITDADAVFLAGMETAVNLLHDGRPRIGERIVVFGQGVVGLLTTALLASLPATRVIALDAFPRRRRIARQLGAQVALDPDALDRPAKIQTGLDGDGNDDPDLIFELSGAPRALQQAIDMSGFDTRIVVGSWYGLKPVSLELGSRFHRDRLRVVSSQVSTICPSLAGRWDKKRRLETALSLVRKLRPAQLITHRIAIADAPGAYALLDAHPEQTLQVVFGYSSSRWT